MQCPSFQSACRDLSCLKEYVGGHVPSELLVVCGSCVAGSCTAWSADFVVHGDQPIIDSFQGFGSHCNAWLYCKPNWGTISTNQNIAQLENLFVDLAPQQMRIFVEIQPDSPQQSDPAVKASVIKTIQLARRALLTVNCTLWHGPYNCLGDNAQQMVDMLVDFIRVQGLTNIKYVTLQNEPNEFGFDTGRWTTLYREVDLRLRFAGLRSQIEVHRGRRYRRRKTGASG